MRPNGNGNMSWAGLVGSNGNRMPRKLPYYPPINSSSDGPVVRFSENVINNGVRYWRNTLIGYFVKKCLSFHLVQSIAQKMWQCFGLIELLSNNSRFIFISF